VIPDLGGRTAFVAAASAGLGYACAEALALRGAALLINGRRAGPLGEAAERLRALDVRVTAIAGDITDTAFRACLPLGEIDILVANAGGPPPGPFETLTEPVFRAAFEANALTTISLVQESLPAMRRRGFGRIVTLLSSAVLRPMPGLDASAAARAAVIAALRGPARAAARDGVTINHLLPGPISTERTVRYLATRSAETGDETQAREILLGDLPAGRLGRPEEVGALCAHLASPLSGFVTGQAIAIDGGRTI
jgi:3-oxoacyl-[acyl-carrier protein] reductase